MCASRTQATAVMPQRRGANVAMTSGGSASSETRPYTPARPSELSSLPTVTWSGRMTAQIPSTASGAAIGRQSSPSSASVNGTAAALRMTPAGHVTSAISRSTRRNAGTHVLAALAHLREGGEGDLADRLGDRVVRQLGLPERHRVEAELRRAEDPADGQVVGVLARKAARSCARKPRPPRTISRASPRSKAGRTRYGASVISAIACAR